MRNEPMDYTTQGFNQFLQRSIGSYSVGLGTATSGQPSRMLNYDQAQVSGSLGDRIQIGSITLDGAAGRISVSDAAGNEVVRIGDLGD